MLRDDRKIWIKDNQKAKSIKKFVRPRKGTNITAEFKERLFFANLRLKGLEKTLLAAQIQKNDTSKIMDDINAEKKRIDTIKNSLDKENSSATSHKFLRRKIKKRSLKQVTTSVREMIIELKKLYPNENISITKEDVAIELSVKECLVEQAFMVLNREGLLSQAVHRAPHDSCRDPHGFENNKEWCSDLYYLR